MKDKLIQLISILFMLFFCEILQSSQIDRVWPDKETRILATRMVNVCQKGNGDILLRLAFVNDRRMIETLIDNSAINHIILVSMYPSNVLLESLSKVILQNERESEKNVDVFLSKGSKDAVLAYPIYIALNTFDKNKIKQLLLHGAISIDEFCHSPLRDIVIDVKNEIEQEKNERLAIASLIDQGRANTLFAATLAQLLKATELTKD